MQSEPMDFRTHLCEFREGYLKEIAVNSEYEMFDCIHHKPVK